MKGMALFLARTYSQSKTGEEVVEMAPRVGLGHYGRNLLFLPA
jgi:hypothetical protein